MQGHSPRCDKGGEHRCRAGEVRARERGGRSCLWRWGCSNSEGQGGGGEKSRSSWKVTA